MTFAQLNLSNTYARPNNNRVVFLGDSITQASNDNAAQTLGTSFPLFAQLVSGGRILMARNAGVSGNVSAQMVSRFSTEVTPYSPSLVHILAGTNDIGTSVPFATYQANIRTLVSQIRNIGALPVLGTIPPNDTAGRHANISLWNVWLKRYAMTNRIPIIDYYALLVDATNGNYSATYGGDGTHPNTAGYLAMGTLCSNTIGSLLPIPDYPLVGDNGDITTTLFNSNAVMITDSNADGIPDGWIAFGGAAGFAHALVTDSAVPGKMEQITMTAAASVRVFERSVAVGAGFSVGDTLAFCAVVTSNGGVTATCKLDFIGSGTNSQPATFTAAITRGLVYQEVVVPSGTTQLNVDFVAGAGTGVVSIGQPTVINLTAKGVLTP